MAGKIDFLLNIQSLKNSIAKIFETFQSLNLESETIREKVISLEEKIKELQYFLQKKVERAFSELVAGAKEKIEVIVSFLAILELAKQKLVTLHQTKPFEEIIIRKQ